MATQAEQIVGADVQITTRDGREITLGRLYLTDWAEIQRVIERKHKGELRGKLMMLKDVGLQADLMPAAIRQMSMDATTREVINYIHTPEGAIVVIKLGAAKRGVDVDQDFFDQFDDPFDLIDIAAQVANLDPPVAPENPADDDGKRGAAGDGPLADGLTSRT